MLGLALKVPDSQAGFVKKLTLAVDLVTGILGGEGLKGQLHLGDQVAKQWQHGGSTCLWG